MKQQKPEKSFFANNMNSLHIAVRAIGKLTPTKEKCYRIKVSLDTETRNQKQNRLLHMWIAERGKHVGNSPDEEKCYCKLTFFVPILLLEDAEFSEFYMSALVNQSYEELLKSMKYVPVTSIMSVKQLAEGLNDMDRTTAREGLVLTQPQDCYMDALMIQEEATQ